jgi:site-specific recombinase XerD
MLFLREVKGYSEATIDIAMASVYRFEEHTRFRDFQKFHIEQARSFKQSLCNTHHGRRLSSATINATLRAVRAFFVWLADQEGYRSRVRYADAAYFTPSVRDQHIATARRERSVPSIGAIETVLRTMPANTDLELRNRALIAFTLLTGARDRAIASFSLKHVNLEEDSVFQDARDVHTKRAKTFKTKFFPVGDLALTILRQWVKYLTENCDWQSDDPLFPATETRLNKDCQFSARGLSRKHWQTAAPIRQIFRDAFAAAGLAYHNPHSFRSTLARLGEKLCRNGEDMKSWSQNLGHERVLTTLTSYGEVPEDRQFEIIARLGKQQTDAEETLERVRQVIGL